MHVVYRLKVDAEHADTVARVHEMHADKCPVYRSIHTSIDITTEVQTEAP